MQSEPAVKLEETDEEARRGRPETFLAAADRLRPLERWNIAFIKKTYESSWLNRLCLGLQRTVGTGWIDLCTRRLRHVHGLERLGPIDAGRPLILASNHRSFFDLYVICAVLYRAGLRQRMLFPVRANFFYDHPLGFLVNGLMSFWSMYPPIFRDKKRLALNHTAMNELARAISEERRSTGIHPEGRRKLDDDPYTFLPAQSGVGRLIHASRAQVVPVFINGLVNDLVQQVSGNFNGRGKKVVIVFGAPIDFGPLLDQPPSARTYKALAERTLEEIGRLGAEERAHRAALEARPEDRTLPASAGG